jgi:hypothetical protein
MARRQLEIAGTQRDDIPPEILEAGEKWLDLRTDKRRVAERAKEAKYGLIALMQARKVETFRYKDPETGETRSLSVDLEPKISVRKVKDDAEPVESDIATSSGPSVHPGLIAQAEKAQAEANVEETADGDVAVPETSAPKAKGKRGKKAKN